MEKKNKIIFKLFEDFKQDQEQYETVLNIIKNFESNFFNIDGNENLYDQTPTEKGDSKTYQINFFNLDRKDVIIVDLIRYCTFYKYVPGDMNNESDIQFKIESEINEITYYTDYGFNQYVIKITNEIKQEIFKQLDIE